MTNLLFYHFSFEIQGEREINPLASVFLIVLLLLLSFVILKWKRENDGEEYVLRRRSIRFSEESQELDELREIPEVRQTYPRRSR